MVSMLTHISHPSRKLKTIIKSYGLPFILKYPFKFPITSNETVGQLRYLSSYLGREIDTSYWVAIYVYEIDLWPLYHLIISNPKKNIILIQNQLSPNPFSQLETKHYKALTQIIIKSVYFCCGTHD